MIHFFDFLNTVLPQEAQLPKDVLAFLQDKDNLAQHMTTERLIKTWCPALTDQDVTYVSEALLSLHSDMTGLIEQVISEGAGMNLIDAPQRLNGFVLLASLQAVLNNALIDFLERLHTDQLRQFVNSQFSKDFGPMKDRLRNNFVEIEQLLGLEQHKMTEGTLIASGSQLFLFLMMSSSDIDKLIDSLNTRIANLATGTGFGQADSLYQLFDVQPVPQALESTPAEADEKGIVRRVERAFLANRPSPPVSDTSLPTEHSAFLRSIGYSMAYLFQHALDYLENPQSESNSARLSLSMINATQYACRLLVSQLRMLQRELERGDSPWNKIIQRSQALRAYVTDRSDIVPQENIVPMTPPGSDQRDPQLTRTLLHILTGESPALQFVQPAVTHESIHQALQTKLPLQPSYSSVVVDALAYFHSDLVSRFDDRSAFYGEFFRLWQQLQQHELVSILSKIELNNIEGLENIHKPKDQWAGLPKLLATLSQNEDLIKLLKNQGVSSQTYAHAVGSQAMPKIFFAHFNYFMSELEALLIDRQSALGGLEHFFEKMAASETGRRILHRLAKTSTLLLPTGSNLLDTKLQGLSEENTTVRAAKLLENIYSASDPLSGRRKRQPNPFREVVTLAIQQTQSTLHALQKFQTQLAHLPWHQEVSAVLKYRSDFMATHPLMDSNIFDTLSHAQQFIRRQEDVRQWQQSLLEFRAILPSYVRACLVNQFFAQLPMEWQNLLTQGKRDVLTTFNERVRDTFFPSMAAQDHYDVNALEQRIDALLQIADSALADSAAVDDFNERQKDTKPSELMRHEDDLVAKYSYTLQAYLSQFSARTRLRIGVTQAQFDGDGLRWIQPSNDGRSPLLSIEEWRTALNRYFLPLTEPQIRFTAYELNGYRVQRWLSDQLLARLQSFQDPQGAVNVPESLDPLQHALIKAALDYVALQRERTSHFVDTIQKRMIRLLEKGFKTQWIAALRSEVINGANDRGIEAEFILGLLQHRLPAAAEIDMQHRTLSEHLTQGFYLEALDELEKQVITATHPQRAYEAMKPEFEKAIYQLTSAITWHHRLQFATLPLEALFCGKENPAYQHIKRQMNEDHERLSTLIQRSLLAEQDDMPIRRSRFDRWLKVLNILLEQGNCYGYDLVYSSLYSMRFLEIARSCISQEAMAAYQSLPVPSVRASKQRFMALDPDTAPLPSLAFFFATTDGLEIPKDRIIFKGLLHDKDVRHNLSEVDQFTRIYECYVNNLLLVERQLPGFDQIIQPNHADDAIWATIQGEQRLSECLSNTAIEENMTLENLAKRVNEQDAQHFPQVQAVTPVRRERTEDTVPRRSFMINSYNINSTLFNPNTITEMLNQAPYFTDIELLKVELFTKDARFLVRLAHLFNTHPKFTRVKCFLINNNQRGYDPAVPLDDRQLLFTMAFCDYFISLVCRSVEFQARNNGLTQTFLSLLLEAWQKPITRAAHYERGQIENEGVYSALGISREEALRLLREPDNAKWLLVAVQETLETDRAFVDTLINRRIISPIANVSSDEAKRLAHNKAVIAAYIDYDVEEKQSEHLLVWHTLAHLRGVSLRIWVLNEEALVPHPTYHTHSIANADMKEVDILFVNHHHIECVTLHSQRNLSSLSLSGNQIGMAANGSAVLSELMSVMPLRQLDVNNNSFGEYNESVAASHIEPRPKNQDAERIAEGIRNCPTLTEIDLGANNFGDAGMRKIFKAMVNHESLTVIKCYKCGMNRSSKHIDKVLKKPDLLQNKITSGFLSDGDLADVALLKLLTQNPRIREVIYDENAAITEQCVERIKQILSTRVAAQEHSQIPHGRENFSISGIPATLYGDDSLQADEAKDCAEEKAHRELTHQPR